MSLHRDLYQATHLHRIAHNGGFGEGICSAWPSPPYQAPMWPIILDVTGAHSFLELGCALGYSVALTASAAGAERSVDAIEIDTSHAAMAEEAIARKGISERVRVFHGDSNDIVPNLPGPYDVVFTDGGGYDDMWNDLRRLTRYGGVVVGRKPLEAEVEKLVELLRARSGNGDEGTVRVYAEVEARYNAAVKKCLVPL